MSFVQNSTWNINTVILVSESDLNIAVAFGTEANKILACDDNRLVVRTFDWAEMWVNDLDFRGFIVLESVISAHWCDILPVLFVPRSLQSNLFTFRWAWWCEPCELIVANIIDRCKVADLVALFCQKSVKKRFVLI